MVQAYVDGGTNVKYKYMKLEVFKEVVKLLKEQEESIDAAYKAGVDLINFNDPISSAVSHLIGTIYGKEGKETFDWWCYEKEWGSRKDFTMSNSKGELVCETIDDLHKWLEEMKLDDYEIKKPIPLEERLEMIKDMFQK